MAAGDVEIKIKIDGEDHSKRLNTLILENSLFSPLGAGAVCNLIDAEDKTGQLKGGEEVEVEITDPDGGGNSIKYKFHLHKGKNTEDGAKINADGSAGGAMKYKRIDCVFRTKEWFTAQGNPVNKSFEDKPEKIAEKVYKDYLKTDKQFEVKAESKTEKKRMIMGNEHPIDGLKRVHDMFVPQNGKSPSLIYHTHDNGQEKFVFTTWQKLFEEKGSVTLKQTMENRFETTSDDEKKKSMFDVIVPQTFTRDSRHYSKKNERAFNLTTHRVYDTKPKSERPEGLPGQPVYDEPKDTEQHTSYTLHHPMNNKKNTYQSEGRANKKAYLAHLAQNEITFSIPFNPDVAVGKMVKLDLINKSNENKGDEKQVNEDVLITDVSLNVRPLGQSPRCIMKCRAVKASYAQAGGGSGW